MSNPWLKMNPFLSMWLSWANWMAGAMRREATVQPKRQISAAVTRVANENVEALLDATAPAAPTARTKQRR